MASASIYNLKHVDYAERGQQLEIIVDGVPKRQTIIFSGTDYFGEKYYFTEQGLRYIQDSRHKLPWQNFVLNYLHKIPIILRAPQYAAISKINSVRFLFYDRIAIKVRRKQKCLLCVVLTKSNINVVWNFYWVERNDIPETAEIIYRSKGAKKP
ncbi:MAG: hypothetical protein ACREOI_23650 [bacterium]